MRALTKPSLHVRKADEAAEVPRYLDGPALIEAARDRQGAQAIHPGYGFLSENAGICRTLRTIRIDLHRATIRCDSPDGIENRCSREIAVRAGAPVVPGTREGLTEPAEALRFAKQAGYPVMLKAVAGGGGKGMRRVDREADLESSFRNASSEAGRAFGDASVYVEKLN